MSLRLLRGLNTKTFHTIFFSFLFLIFVFGNGFVFLAHSAVTKCSHFVIENDNASVATWGYTSCLVNMIAAGMLKIFQTTRRHVFDWLQTTDLFGTVFMIM